MLINADFTRRAVVHAASRPWVASPIPGVERRMLDRVGDEIARATSIVRYAAGSAFSPHTHGGGEEFLVLEGIFQDERGDYPVGSYVRNPPQSRHTPRSQAGCILFVKLHQFDADDRRQLQLDTNTVAPVADLNRPGVLVQPLHADARETVRIESIDAHAYYDVGDEGGCEMLVLSGQLEAGGESFETLSWMRLPPGDKVRLTAGPHGARVWVKLGHLKSEPSAPKS
jgi:anti-sigma factor ChrR (cupin superfamily)